MTEIRFYHLQRTPLEQALPKMLEMCLSREWKAVVMARSEERVAALSDHLWTFDDRGFLPHGDKRDGHAEQQPIWLTPEDENPNGATVLFLTDGAISEAIGSYDLVCRLFDGRDDEAVADARARWAAEKEAGHTLTYWQQTDRGWEKKASTATSEDA
ncbi:MAG: DNA polymerase III subunit chi [Alphaproteobacteria bacterium]|uniref:DNA polymerase III subunit chi n=1 Tax=Pacificispira sp. TaxID=2888761 RepID=UPI0032F3C5C0